MMLNTKDPKPHIKKHIDTYDTFPLSVPNLMCSRAWLIPNTEYFVAIGSFDYAFDKRDSTFWGLETSGEQEIIISEEVGTGLHNGKPDGFTARYFGIFGNLPFIIGKKINDEYIPMFATALPDISTAQHVSIDALGDNYIYSYSIPYAINLYESPFLNIDMDWSKPRYFGKYPYINISLVAGISVHADRCEMIRRSKEYVNECAYEYDDLGNKIPYVSDSTGTYTAYLHYDIKNYNNDSGRIITFSIPTSFDENSISYKSILYNGISSTYVYNEKIYNTYDDLRKAKEDMYEFLSVLTGVAHTMKDENVTKLAFEEEISLSDDYYAPFTYVNESDTTSKKTKSERPLIYIN